MISPNIAFTADSKLDKSEDMAAMSGACQPTALSCGQGKILDIVDASCNVLGLLWYVA